MKLEYFSLQWQEKIPGILVQLESKEKLAACVPEFPEFCTEDWHQAQLMDLVIPHVLDWLRLPRNNRVKLKDFL